MLYCWISDLVNCVDKGDGCNMAKYNPLTLEIGKGAFYNNINKMHRILTNWIS